jgi:tetraacyldisaccharide 4'-kinase
MLNLHLLIIKLWKKNSIFLYLMFVFSGIYFIVSKLKEKFTKGYVSKKFIICVGNVVVGGAGKTPIAKFIAESLIKKGYKICFLSRGYKKKSKEKLFFVINTDLDYINPILKEKYSYKYSSYLAGDEAYMLSFVAPVCVSSNRVKAIQEIEKYDFDIVIMDDGLQNYNIIKNYSILVFDSFMGVLNGKILPMGPLREKISNGVKKSNLIVINGDKNEKLEKQIFQNKKNLDIKLCYNKIDMENYNLHGIIKYNKNGFLVFCSIGYPDKFYNFLKINGINVKKTVEYPDHYFYTKNDLKNLEEMAVKYNLKLMTTEKDSVKIDGDFLQNVIVVNLKLKIDNFVLEHIMENYEKFKN